VPRETSAVRVTGVSVVIAGSLRFQEPDQTAPSLMDLESVPEVEVPDVEVGSHHFHPLTLSLANTPSVLMLKLTNNGSITKTVSVLLTGILHFVRKSIPYSPRNSTSLPFPPSAKEKEAQ